MKTYTAKPSEVTPTWYVVDAQDVVLGRLASIVAMVLRGKHKPNFTPHIDTGHHVVVVNAEKVRLTGRKREQKVFYWHTGHPGGIKGRTAAKILDGKHPERVIQKAVERMLPKGTLGRNQLGKLKVYAGGTHPHEAQTPQALDIGAMNPKNKRSA